jgi:hypothetical protein
MEALGIIAAIVALGMLYVVIPTARDAYRRFRGSRVVVCPETDTPAVIGIDATAAAMTATVGTPYLEVNACSHWPERQHCGQDCLAQVSPGSPAEQAPPR